MVHKLRNGGSVEARWVGQRVEFTTRNAGGDVISTVQHTFSEALPLLHALRTRRA